MKKTLMICCMIAAISIQGYSQNVNNGDQTRSASSSLEVLSNRIQELNDLFAHNKIADIDALYKTIVVQLLGEIGKTERTLVSKKGTSEETYYTDLIKKQNKLYGDVLAVRDDISFNMAKLNQSLNEFMEISLMKN